MQGGLKDHESTCWLFSVQLTCLRLSRGTPAVLSDNVRGLRPKRQLTLWLPFPFIYSIECLGYGPNETPLALYPNLHSQCTHPLCRSDFSCTVPQFDYTIASRTDRKIVTLDSEAGEATSCLGSKLNS